MFSMKTLIRLIYIALGCALLYYATTLLQNALGQGGIPTDVPILLVMASAACYFLSHIMRAMRLVILAEDPSISLRGLMTEQFKANGVNLALPFRLGEAYRVVFFKPFFKSYYRSFIFLLTERIFDFSAVLLLFHLACWWGNIHSPMFVYVNLFTGFVVALIIGFFFMAEDTLLILHRLVLSRYTTPWAVKFVSLSGQIIQAIRDVKAILNKRVAACLAFTSAIWALEVAAFMMFIHILNDNWDALLALSSLVSLSSLLPSGPAGYGGVQMAFHGVGQVWGPTYLVAYSLWYNLFIFLPAIILAVILFFAPFFKKEKEAHDTL